MFFPYIKNAWVKEDAKYKLKKSEDVKEMSSSLKQTMNKILPKQTMDFSVPTPKPTGQISMTCHQNTVYREDFKTWSFMDGGIIKFNLVIAKPIIVDFTLRLCAADVDGVANCPYSISVNGHTVVSGCLDSNDHWHDTNYVFDKNWMKEKNNEIIISLDKDATTQLFLKTVTVWGEE